MSNNWDKFGEGFKQGVEGAFRIISDHENPLDVARDIQRNANQENGDNSVEENRDE